MSCEVPLPHVRREGHGHPADGGRAGAPRRALGEGAASPVAARRAAEALRAILVYSLDPRLTDMKVACNIHAQTNIHPVLYMI